MDLQSQYWGEGDAVALLSGRAAANIHRGNYESNIYQVDNDIPLS